MANVFRADQVGSLVKPRALLEAESAHEAGALDAKGLAAAREVAIRDALILQKKTGVTVVTDGEFRRRDPDSLYVQAIAGIQQRDPHPARPGDPQDWRSQFRVASPLRLERRLTAHETQFLQAQTKLPYKVSLLAPSALALRMYEPGITDRSYPSLSALAVAFGEIVLREIEALSSDGVRYIQVNSPAYAWLCDSGGRSRVGLPGQAPANAFADLLAVDVGILKRVNRSANSALGLHVSRCAGMTDADDSYERMLEQVLPVAPVDRFLLEYPAPQPHDFSSLRTLPEGKIAVLGLITGDAPPQEVDDVLTRFDQAMVCTDEKNLALSPRRGFTNVPGRTPEALFDLQRRCLERTSEVVQRIWGLEL
jgi:5-methyltetrahydropteroyltriglutamate--homocysteine methyltransferase